jgi:hypothetical protein
MKKVGIIALAALVAGSLGYMVFGMAGADAPSASEPAAAGAGGEAGVAAGAGAAGAEAAKVGREENEGGDAPPPDKDLKLPGQLPSLGLKAPPELETPTKVEPDQPELEGTIEAVDAQQAINAIFPRVRGCYAELRERAPQAKGYMLMKVKVRRSDDGTAGTGELFLKETQFTDPKYLTCIRTAIDETKFQTASAQIDGSATFKLWLTPEDVDRHNAWQAAQGGGVQR